MLFLDGVYVDGANGSSVRFQWTTAPTSAELTQLARTIAHRVGRFLERQGLLERDAENGYLADNAVQAGSLDQLLGHAITYRIAVGPHKGRKVFSLQTLPACCAGAEAPGQLDSIGCGTSLFLTLLATFGCPNSLQVNLSWSVRPQQRASSTGDAIHGNNLDAAP